MGRFDGLIGNVVGSVLSGNTITPEGQVPENSNDEIADGLSTLEHSPGLR